MLVLRPTVVASSATAVEATLVVATATSLVSTSEAAAIATSGLCPLLSLVYYNSTTINLSSIKFLDSFFGLLIIGHLYKPKPFTSSGELVGNNSGCRYFAVLFKKFL